MRQCVMALLFCMASSSGGIAQAREPARAPPGSERVAEPEREHHVPIGKNGDLAPGSYMLLLTPLRLGGKPVPRGVEPIATSVTVHLTGGKMSVANAAGLILEGKTSGARFSVSGKHGDGALTLTGTAARDGADGDFELTFTSGPQAEGGFILASPNSAGIQASRQLQDYDEARKAQRKAANCNWWCRVRRRWGNYQGT